MEIKLNFVVMNISSIVVQTKPENLSGVLNTIKNSDLEKDFLKLYIQQIRKKNLYLN